MVLFCFVVVELYELFVHFANNIFSFLFLRSGLVSSPLSKEKKTKGDWPGHTKLTP